MAYFVEMFTFVESSVFGRLRDIYLTDAEYSELQQFMMLNPDSRHVVPGSGGVRKLAGRALEWANDW